MAVKVLWLTPDKPMDISVGRQRIATHLEDETFDVTLRGTTRRTTWHSLRERHDYDVVIGTTRAGALAGVAVRFVSGLPLVVDNVDPIRQWAETASRPLAMAVEHAENHSFRLSAATLYVYEEERDRVERYAPRSVKTTLGVDFDRFATPDESILDHANKRLSEYTLAENVVIYVGGLEPIYHIEELLQAVSQLSDWSLVIAGVGSLQSTIEAAHDGTSVIYLGTVPQEEIQGYLHAADVGISLVDDLHTLKVLEYAAAGLPVVQLDGRARERFGDRVVYTDVSSQNISRAIETAIDHNPGPLHAFAKQFDWSEIAKTYAHVIKSVI